MADNTEAPESMKLVKHVILILSGKGGVGKSTVATQLAWALYNKGHKVGLLDVDLCGPSVPRMMNIESQDVHQCSDGWVPVYTSPDQRLGVMSIGFLLQSKNDAIVWRGPKKNAMIKQFLSDVCWGEMDYLIIDTPPGTSDEHITVVENLRNYNPDGAVLVTTPQGMAISDVRREVTFCHKTKIPVLGIIENMSGFVCPHCSVSIRIQMICCIGFDLNMTHSGQKGIQNPESMIQKANLIHKDSLTACWGPWMGAPGNCDLNSHWECEIYIKGHYIGHVEIQILSSSVEKICYK